MSKKVVTADALRETVSPSSVVKVSPHGGPLRRPTESAALSHLDNWGRSQRPEGPVRRVRTSNPPSLKLPVRQIATNGESKG